MYVNALTSLKPSSHAILDSIQLGVIKVTNRQIAPQLLKYFGEAQPFVCKHSQVKRWTHQNSASRQASSI
jgi:hypothetical protein